MRALQKCERGGEAAEEVGRKDGVEGTQGVGECAGITLCKRGQAWVAGVRMCSLRRKLEQDNIPMHASNLQGQDNP